MNVLVTGGAGFIGSHLVDRLIELGHETVIFDNLDEQVHPTCEKPPYVNPKAHFVEGDVRDYDALSNVVREAEVVFHQAGAVGVGQSQYQVKKYSDVNVGGTTNLLDILVNEKHHVKKLIVAASKSSYGEGMYRCDACGDVRIAARRNEDLRSGKWEPFCPKCGKGLTPAPTGEDARQIATSIYAITKKVQEQMALCIGATYGIPTVALRYFNVYGPRQSLSNPYSGVCAIFMSRIKNDRPPVIYEDGLQTLDFVSVHDVVQANILSMEKDAADYQVFNVGTGKPVTIESVARLLAKIYKKDIEPEITNRYRKGDIRYCYPDVSKIHSLLGYEPHVSLEEGMRELVAWADKEEAIDKFDMAERELKEKGLA